MTRNIRQVSHDIMPMLKTIQDLSSNLNTMLPQLYKSLALTDAKMKDHFETSLSALRALDECTKLAIVYVDEVDAEAKQAGLEKHY